MSLNVILKELLDSCRSILDLFISMRIQADGPKFVTYNNGTSVFAPISVYWTVHNVGLNTVLAILLKNFQKLIVL